MVNPQNASLILLIAFVAFSAAAQDVLSARIAGVWR